MGKKVINSQSTALRISKNEKKQLNSLIRVLRPKVYITDSSSFKGLVQELTGNGNESPVFSPPPPMQKTIDGVPVIDIEDHGYEDSSTELSYNSSDLFVPTSFPALDSSLQELCFPAPYEVGLSQERDLESWLLDMDVYNYDGFVPAIQQEIKFPSMSALVSLSSLVVLEVIT
ncbi:hypothetical protein RJ639_025910 [Escallonia herrerae]|uniref:VQ domain-containing protein n=1 Tax=Escallonia herrerae TaxID=1293975 RepID=A0AA88UXE9_9ASTE|nr:hypothetical protein RJ639_025910 [Escallonia herrerae]